MRSLRYPFAVGILAYLAVLIWVFWPILLPPEGTLVFGDDIHRSYHFFRQLFGDAVRQGEFPWWNPYINSGEPLIANPSVAFWYPVNWLFAVLPYRYVYSWIIPFHIFWAMVGMYVLMSSRDPAQRGVAISKGLLRRFAPRNDTLVGPWISGLVFGLSGYFMGRIWEGHIELIAAASWMPWVIYANVKCQMSNVKWKTNCVLAGIVFALQLYAGYQTMALFTLEAVLVVTSFVSYFEKSWRPFLRAGVAVAIGLGLAAVQIIPAQEFFRASIRTYELPYSWAVFGSYTLENLKQLIDPFILGLPSAYRGPGPNFGEMAAYMGKASLVLALFGLVYAFKRRFVVGMSMAVIALFGLWVSFGWNAPVDLNKLLWDIVPTYKYLRIPSRHLILLVFGASVLVAYSLSFVRHRLAKLVIAFVVVVDLVWFARHFVMLKPDPITRHNKELVTYLQKNSGLTRVLPNFNVGMGTRDALDFDAAMGYRFYSASGYDPAILRNYYEFAAAAGGIDKPDVQTSDVQIPYLNPASRYADFLNIKYFFVPSWFDSVAGSSPKFRLVIEENKKDFFRLYENAQVLPRFFLVSTLVALPDREAIARAIRMEEYDASRVVLVGAKDVAGTALSGDCGSRALPAVTVVSYGMNQIILNTDAPCSAFLATSEIMYPGWQATIDGTPTTLIEGNLAFRTLPVPAGFHTIVMSYQPKSSIIGLLVTVATALGCLVLTKSCHIL